MKSAPGTVRAVGVYAAAPRRAQSLCPGNRAMTGTARSSSGLEPRRRRLLYRLWHRGTREMDLIMGRFADAVIADLTESDIGALERIAEVPDPELYGWLTGAIAVPRDFDVAVFRRLHRFHQAGQSE
jgi:antitoxin CptB